jgi:hypothetical protein
MSTVQNTTQPDDQINDSAHYHVGGSAGGPGENSAECACGTVFDGFDTHAEVMAVLGGHVANRLPGTVAGLRAAAVTALEAWSVDSPERAARLLQSWARRPEMTDGDVVVVLDAMFPAGDPSEDVTRIDYSEVRRFAARLVELGCAINPDGDPTYLVERISALLAEGVTPTPPESEWAQFPACPSLCTGAHDEDGQFRDCESEEMFVPQHGDRVVCVNVGTTFNRATGLSTPVLVRLEDHAFTPRYARRLALELIRAADLVDG